MTKHLWIFLLKVLIITRYKIKKISTNVDKVIDKKIFIPLNKEFTKYAGKYYSPFSVKKLLDQVEHLWTDHKKLMIGVIVVIILLAIAFLILSNRSWSTFFKVSFILFGFVGYGQLGVGISPSIIWDNSDNGLTSFGASVEINYKYVVIMNIY